jgi:hypothetical protein
MFFLGHMCWAYVFGKGASRITSRRVQIQLILLCGVLPDVDLLLRIEHGGITHSIAFWVIAYVPIMLYFGSRQGLPYFISTAQHFLFGDFITGRYKILLPFSNGGFGLGLGLLSPLSLSLEALGLSAFLAFAYITKDLKSLFSMKSDNLISLLPTVAMLVSYVAFVGQGGMTHGFPAFEILQVTFLLLFFCSFMTGMVGIISRK